MLHCLATDDGASPYTPLRPVNLAHLLRGFSFALTVIPLLKVRINYCYISETSDLAGLTGPLPGTHKDGCKLRA